MTHDFKAALDDLNKFLADTDKYNWEDIVNFVAPHKNTIRRALLIADALMVEQPHWEVLTAGNLTTIQFKAMRDKIIEGIKSQPAQKECAHCLHPFYEGAGIGNVCSTSCAREFYD